MHIVTCLLTCAKSSYRLLKDAMAGVRELGKPSLFITMTTNPNWRQIQEELGPGQKPEDRPDIAVKVFRQKMVGTTSTIRTEMRQTALFYTGRAL